MESLIALWAASPIVLVAAAALAWWLRRRNDIWRLVIRSSDRASTAMGEMALAMEQTAQAFGKLARPDEGNHHA